MVATRGAVWQRIRESMLRTSKLAPSPLPTTIKSESMRQTVRSASTSVLFLIAVLLASGCAPQIYSFADPQFGRDRLFEAPNVLPPAIGVHVDYSVNGKLHDGESQATRDYVANILGASRLTQIIQQEAETPYTPMLVMVISHTYDAAEARNSGLAVGVTFGGTKREIRDEFSIQVSLKDPKKPPVREVLYDTGELGVYRHAIVTRAGGNAQGLLPSDYPGAYKRVLESVLTQFLKDLGTAERDANPIIFVPDTRPDEE